MNKPTFLTVLFHLLPLLQAATFLNLKSCSQAGKVSVILSAQSVGFEFSVRTLLRNPSVPISLTVGPNFLNQSALPDNDDEVDVRDPTISTYLMIKSEDLKYIYEPFDVFAATAWSNYFQLFSRELEFVVISKAAYPDTLFQAFRNVGVKTIAFEDATVIDDIFNSQSYDQNDETEGVVIIDDCTAIFNACRLNAFPFITRTITLKQCLQ